MSLGVKARPRLFSMGEGDSCVGSVILVGRSVLKGRSVVVIILPLLHIISNHYEIYETLTKLLRQKTV